MACVANRTDMQAGRQVSSENQIKGSERGLGARHGGLRAGWISGACQLNRACQKEQVGTGGMLQKSEVAAKVRIPA